MLRVAAGIHDTVPKAVVEKVTELRQNGTRRIGRVRLSIVSDELAGVLTLLPILVDSDAISSSR
jgi:hypothetical protein